MGVPPFRNVAHPSPDPFPQGKGRWAQEFFSLPSPWGRVGDGGSAVMAGCIIASVVHPPRTPPSREGDLGITSESDFLKDRFNHAVGVLNNLAVPESDHAVAMRFNDLLAACINLFRMLPAITLNRKPQSPTSEVDNEITDLMLAGELHTELTGSKARPQPALGISHVVAELARNAGQSLFRQSRTPIPNPSLKGREF